MLDIERIMQGDNAEEKVRQAEKADRESLESGEKYLYCGLDPVTDTESLLMPQIVNRADKMGILRMHRATLYGAVQEHFMRDKFPLSRLLFSKDFIFADTIDMYHYAVDN